LCSKYIMNTTTDAKDICKSCGKLKSEHSAAAIIGRSRHSPNMKLTVTPTQKTSVAEPTPSIEVDRTLSGGTKPKATGLGVAALRANLAFKPAMLMGGPPPKLNRGTSNEASTKPVEEASFPAGDQPDAAALDHITARRAKAAKRRPPTCKPEAPKAEEKPKREAEEQAKIKAEEAKARQEQEERLKREAEAKARQEQEERLKREAEAKARQEQDERLKHEVEEKARQEQEERLKHEAEENAKVRQEEVKREAEAKARQEQEERLKREKARQEQEERLKHEAEENAKVRQEEVKREAEAKARQEQEERLKREKASQKEEENRLKREAEEEEAKSKAEAAEAKSKAATEEARRQVRTKDAMRRDRSQLPSSFVPFSIKFKKNCCRVGKSSAAVEKKRCWLCVTAIVSFGNCPLLNTLCVHASRRIPIL
jgi:hypothetical protein